MTETQQSSQTSHTKLRGPGKWNVLMLNDDVTPMEFVVQILISVFGLSQDQATHVMLEVHEKGRSIAGAYMYEIAEQKTNETLNSARMAGYPLVATVEEA
jgi:ATP-dependent Clp protease adaptor protein ClpS